MSTVKYTAQRGKVALKDVAMAAGVAEAQSDTLSVNIDFNRLTKCDALIMIDCLKQAIHRGKWPPDFGFPVPPQGFVFLIDPDGAYLVDPDGAYLVEVE